MLCPACGVRNDADCKFCTTCGFGLSSQGPNTKVCLRCRSTLPADSKFCGNCGFVLVPPPVQVAQEPEPPSKPLVPSASLPSAPKTVGLKDALGFPLTEWRQGRYRSAPDGNGGAPGLVWLHGRWLDPSVAAEYLAKLEEDLAKTRSELSGPVTAWRETVWAASLRSAVAVQSADGEEASCPAADNSGMTAADDWLTEGLLPPTHKATESGASRLAEALAGCAVSSEAAGIDALNPSGELCWLLAEALRADATDDSDALGLAEVPKDGQSVFLSSPKGSVESSQGQAGFHRVPLADVAPSTQALLGPTTKNADHAS